MFSNCVPGSHWHELGLIDKDTFNQVSVLSVYMFLSVNVLLVFTYWYMLHWTSLSVSLLVVHRNVDSKILLHLIFSCMQIGHVQACGFLVKEKNEFLWFCFAISIYCILWCRFASACITVSQVCSLSVDSNIPHSVVAFNMVYNSLVAECNWTFNLTLSYVVHCLAF